MQINHQCEASRPLQSALKAKAKIVGIPIPGHAPLIFHRTKLQRMLKGVQPTSVIAEVGDGKNRFLCIRGRAGAVSTTMRILSLSRYDALRLMESKDKALDRLTRPKSNKYDAAIKKLQNEMGAAPRILAGWNRSGHTIDTYERSHWLSWRENKAERTLHFREEMERTSRELARINTRSYRPGRSFYHWEPKPEEMWGPKRYTAYLEWRNFTAPIREQIASIQQMKAEAA